VLAALIEFLSGREADLVATADAIGVTPVQLVRAGERLSA
jgi:hypothetical protein